MVSGPGGINSASFLPQQQIKFRPDPGEPAVRLSAPPSQTAGLVSSQEQRNETRLLLRALSKGDDVLYSKRTFTLGLTGSSPVYNAGLTTLVSREDPNGAAPDQVIGPVTSQDELRASQEEESKQEEAQQEEEEETNPLNAAEENEEETSPVLGAAEEDEEELESEETEIENEDQRVDRNLTIAQLEQQQALRSGDPVQVEQTEREIKQLEREAEEVEKEKKENEQKQTEIRLKELQGTANQAIEDTLNAALGIIGVLFGLGSGQENENAPLTNTPN